MEITGKLIQLGEVTEGQSQKGEWRKVTAIFETNDQYPKQVAVLFWDNSKKEMVETIRKVPIGTECLVKFDVASREFNGKWYTDCTAFAIEPATQQAPAKGKAKKQQEEDLDDLPW